MSKPFTKIFTNVTKKGENLIQNKIQIDIVKELKDLFISFISTNETMHVSPSNCLKHNVVLSARIMVFCIFREYT